MSDIDPQDPYCADPAVVDWVYKEASGDTAEASLRNDIRQRWHDAGHKLSLDEFAAASPLFEGRVFEAQRLVVIEGWPGDVTEIVEAKFDDELGFTGLHAFFNFVELENEDVGPLGNLCPDCGHDIDMDHDLRASDGCYGCEGCNREQQKWAVVANHHEACSYTIKATQEEITAHLKALARGVAGEIEKCGAWSRLQDLAQQWFDDEGKMNANDVAQTFAELVQEMARE